MRNKMIVFVSILLVALALSGCFLLKPEAPILDVSFVSSSSITLNWTENSSVDGFKLYKEVNGKFTLLANIDKTQRSYTDNSVEQNTTYSYKMLSYKLSVNSGWSNVVNDTTAYVLSGYVKDPSNSPVSNVIMNFDGYSSVTTDGNGFWHKDGLKGTVTLTPQKTGWTFTPSSITINGPNDSMNFVGVEIPTTPFNPHPTNSSTNVSISSSLSWQCSGSLLKYDVHFGTSINPPIVALSLGQNSYNPSHLDYATTYYWQVTARNSVGNATGPLWSFTTESTPVPSAPTNLEITSYSTNSISMSWTDNSNDEDGFEIARSKDSVYFYTVKDLPSNTIHYTNQNLSSNTLYYYKVRAYNSGGYSGWSNVVNVRTASDNLPPSKPSNPTPSDGAASVSTNTSLSWQDSDPNGDTLTYDVYFSTTSNPSLPIDNVSATTYYPGNLSDSTTYYWKIVAKDGKGGVTSGDVWSFTTTTPAGTGTVNGEVDVYTGESGFVSSSSKPISTGAKWQIASHPKNKYIPNEVIVGFKSGFKVSSLTSNMEAPFNYTVKSTLRTPNDEVNIALVKVSTSVEEAIDYFKKLSNVKYAEPNYISYALSTPNDAYYSKQWGLTDVNIPQVWQSETKGANTVVVAVVDTGVSPTHPDLQGVLVNGYNFVSNNTNTADDYGHGTHVAGIIAADTNNSIGIAGVNWGGTSSTKIMPIKVLDSSGSGNDYWVAEGIVYAVKHGAKVINMSLGGDGLSYTERDACQYAYDNGVTLVAAAGNDGSNTLDYPAAFPTVIPVAAVGPDNSLAHYSNYTSDVICAPGGAMNYQGDPNGIVSTYYATSTQSDTYAYLQGTSMAAPYVSGIIALMISNGITDPANIWNVIKNTATNIGPSSQYGYGLINAYNAVMYNGGEPMSVWAEDQNSNVVDLTWIDNDGSYSLTLPSGIYKIYAWQDFNGDGVLDTGDFYGYAGYNGGSSDQIQSINVGANSSINVNIFVSPEVDDTNNPLGVSQTLKLKSAIQKAAQQHYEQILFRRHF